MAYWHENVPASTQHVGRGRLYAACGAWLQLPSLSLRRPCYVVGLYCLVVSLLYVMFVCLLIHMCMCMCIVIVMYNNI